MRQFFIFLLSSIFVLANCPRLAFANVNDFYFKTATFDYFLSRNSNHDSELYTVETLTAVFPDFDQNHGIERCLPIKYQLVDSLDRTSIKVTDNGVPAEFTTSSEDSAYCLRIGSASTYVHGEHTYQISYRRQHVILNPDDATVQEFYWDTNGTGWSQAFNSLTATVHLDSSIASSLTGQSACYVGVQGANGADRCQIRQNSDTITFSAQNLAPRENLTLALAFLTDTFFVPKPQVSPLFFIILALLAVFIALFFRACLRDRQELKPKRELAHAPKPVQYLPPKGLTVAEATAVWLHNRNAPDTKVATLLELAVTHKIELERGEKKAFGGYTWKIHPKQVEGLSTDQTTVLQILNNGQPAVNDQTFTITKHSSSAKLIKLANTYHDATEDKLEQQKLLIDPPAKSTAHSGVFAVISFTLMFITFWSTAINGAALLSQPHYYPLLALSAIGILVYLIILFTDFAKNTVFRHISEQGIELSNYLDGLKEYMTLAEADRIKFLQSVSGADLSHQGIVKLYEKLLPYAIVFRLEDSWVKELNRYYAFDDVADSDWLIGAAYLSAQDLRNFHSSTANIISQSTMSSSSSSGSSGGGFSGGGGGGGGGGGW